MRRLPILLALALAACGGESDGGDPSVVVLDPNAPAPARSAPESGAPSAETPNPGAAPRPEDTEGTPEDPVVEPLKLVVDSPARGARTQDGSIRVSGRLNGGERPTLTIAGWTVQPDDDGSFAIDIPVERGLTILATEAVDSAGRTVEDRRAVLVGATAEVDSEVEDAMHLAIGRDALDTASALISDYLSELDVWSLLGGSLPDGVEVEALSYGRINVRIVPRRGYLQVFLAVDRLQASVAGTVTRLGVSATFRGSASADPAEVVARVEINPAADGTLEFEVLDAEVSLRRFDYDIRYVPGFLEDWFADLVRGQLEGIVERTMREFVVPALFNEEALTRTVEVLGTEIEVGMGVSELDITPEGLTVALDAVAHAPAVRRAGRALPTSGARPSMDAKGDVDLAVSAGLLSRLAHTAWAAGLLDFALDETSDFDLPITLTPALIAPMLGEAASSIDFRDPLYVRTSPLLPPVVTIEDGERPLVMRMGDLLVELSTPSGPLVTVAVQIEARAALTVETGDQISIDPDLEVTVHADVAHTPNGPVEEARLERLVEELAALIPGLIADETFAFGADVIPVPIRLLQASVRADASGAPFAHLTAAVD